MKRLITSIIILTIIIFSSFSFPIYLKNTTNKIIYKIDNINYDIKSNNLNAALNKTQKLSEYWSKKSDIIMTFVDNDDINMVSYNIAKLIPLLKYHNLSQSLATLNYIKAIILSIYETDIPSISNIF